MLKIDEALGTILATTVPFEISNVALSGSRGLAMGVDVYSSTDLPRFDKSLMDGYAVRSSDLIAPSVALHVVEVILAGRVPTKSIGPGEAAQIMTGAALPDGVDVVVKVEDTRRDGDKVVICSNPPSAGANVIRQGTSIRANASVLQAGMVLNGARIGALAELGQSFVAVRRRPRVAILATGDELVPIEVMPGPGQINNSNEVMLGAQIESAGGIAVPLGIARDDRDILREKIMQGLNCDIMVLSGGVSAGTVDLVPEVLAAVGVQQVFHKVEMKPGKPVWFGQWKGSEKSRCVVFGLPGNPVSSLVCCELFVRTAIRRLMGIEPAIPQPIPGKLEHNYSTRSDRPTYHPAKLTWTADGLSVTLVSWHGSSDLCGTVFANGMAFLSGEAHDYRVGDRLETYAW